MARFVLLCRWQVRLRAKVLAKLIDVADKLRKHNNFQILMAVVSGINGCPVSRLKWTKQRLSRRHRKVCECRLCVCCHASFRLIISCCTDVGPIREGYVNGGELQDLSHGV